MDGWMDQRMNGRVGWVNGWMDQRMDGCVGWMNE